MLLWFASNKDEASIWGTVLWDTQ